MINQPINRVIMVKAKSKAHFDELFESAQIAVDYLKHDLNMMSKISLHNQKKAKAYQRLIDALGDFRYAE